MGVDLGTYRGRIGTFKFAFGNDVITVNCYINFSRGLGTISVVTFIGVLFLLASTDTWSIQKEHATAILATNPQQPGSVWFVDMLLLMAGIEPNPGPILCDKILSMLMVVVVFLAMVYFMTYTDTSQSTKIFSVCVALLIIAVIYIQGSMNGTTAFGQRIIAQDERPSQPEETDAINLDEKLLYEIENSSADNATETEGQIINAEDERTSQPNENDVESSDEQLPLETEHGRNENDSVTSRGSVSTSQRMNEEDKRTSKPKKEHVITSDEQLPFETENENKDNNTKTAKNLKDQDSVSISQSINAEDERPSQPSENDVECSDEQLPLETEHGRNKNDTVTSGNLKDRGSVSTSQRMNSEDESISKPKKEQVTTSDEQLPIETENENKDNKAETASIVKGHDSVSKSRRDIAENERTSQSKKIDVVNAGQQLPNETEHGSIKSDIETATNLKGQGFVSIGQGMNAEDEMTSKPKTLDVVNSDGQLPYKKEHGSNDNETGQRMNAKDERTSQPNSSDVVNSHEQLPYETEIRSKDNETETASNVNGQGFVPKGQRMIAEDERTSQPKTSDEVNLDEQLPYEKEHGSKENDTETDQGSVSTSQRLNAGDKRTSQPKEIDVESSDEQLPHETEYGRNKNYTVTSGILKDRGSVSTSQRTNAEDERTSKPKKEHVITSDEHLTSQIENENKDNKTETENNNEGKMFFNLLNKLGLADKFPGKLSRRDIMEADCHELKEQENQCISFFDIPWLFLKRLISVHSECRDIKVTKDDICEINSDFMSEMPDESQDISPLDVIHVVFQCLDPFMKQLFVQKSYLCKLSVPLLYKQWITNEFYKTILSVWPLRSLAIENRAPGIEGEKESKEVDILQLKTHVLAFSRFGRPHYSKSKLINSLLTNQSCETFFNIGCPSGMAQKYVSNGQIEMFWLPTIGDKKDRFHQAVTYLNMRGDINEHFDRDVLSFMSSFVDVFVIIVDAETLLTYSDKVKIVIAKFSSVILIIANPISPEEENYIQGFQKDLLDSGTKLPIARTHKGVVEQNVSIMLKHIQSQLKDKQTQSYEQRLSSAKLPNLETDEDNEFCQKGKNEANLLIKKMKDDGSPKTWKQVLTPVHCIFSQQLGKLMKDREREKNFSEGDNIDLKIKTIREKQTQSVTETVQLFIEILIRNETSPLALNFFLCWVKFHIEREKRKILSQLMYESNCAWEGLKELKSENTNVESDTVDKTTVISNLERKIDEASFTVEHFFREIGHLYEAILELNLCSTELRLPQLIDIAKVIGRLVADGHQLELIDGESFYMPYLWTKAVLKEVDRFIGSGKIMTLSVLGLQSSGKSTLLNTMFGSLFSTRTGRCTRGIHVQLVPAKFAGLVSSQFNYVLVVDTEGLRSPDLSHTQHEHDNELATVITGIGDITMLNVMGENIGEIRDILQVIVHAFLRLKMTNPKLDIRKSCAFIHQNVADISASENMRSGLRKLMQTLDEMTKESARSEGISEITTFNQVIEFDINSQVWYLKNLWQGNPPMAKVNSEYSERVVDIKCQILNKAFRMKDKSYKCISDVVDQAHSLWKGVLNEDFVFSFRNSLEIKAYMETEKFVQGQLWHLESFIRDELITITQSRFANCNEKDDLRKVTNTLINELNDVLIVEKVKTQEDIKTYFEGNKYKDIIIQWKTDQKIRIDSLCLTLKQIILHQIEKSQERRSVEILTLSSNATHEEELRKKSMEVANKYKGKEISNTEKDKLFNDIWQSFMTKVDSTTTTTETIRTPMKTIFERCLINIFQQHGRVIKDALIQSKDLSPIPNLEKLTGSFAHTGIHDKDISLTFLKKKQNNMKHITSRVNQIFENVDDKILQLCQVNDEITDMAINKLVHELDTSIHGILTGNTEFCFKSPFYAKIYVHVCRYAHPVFEKHNEIYFKTQGTAARLEQYKQQQRISFEAHLDSRRSEDIVAKLFSHVIEVFANECTQERLPNKITDELHSLLPSVKNILIVEICSDLLEKDNFENFISYIHAPKEYVCSWLTKKANNCLFGEQNKLYSNTSKSLLKQFFKAVEKSLQVLMKDNIAKPPPSIDTWINDFQSLIQRENFFIPPESFRNLKQEIKDIKNVEYLTNETIANMMVSEDKMIAEFSKYDSSSVRWAHSNPIDRIMQKVWGCPEQCHFCGEPCAKNENHDGSVHYSIQHRPSCCKGIRFVESQKAFLTSCGFDIQSNTTHTCGVFDYLCNKGTRENCSLGKHNYRDYKQFLPQWDIAPTSNMHDSSKFWMWFVATYKKQLHKKYNYKIDDIPKSWKDISKQQAKESLMKTYNA